MTGSFKEKLATAVGVACEPERPVCDIQRTFDDYKRHMSGKIIKTPLRESVHLRDENFPHWIKLQKWNPSIKAWQDAYATAVLPKLLDRTFDDEGYRSGDVRRIPALLNVPHLLKDPDKIRRDNDDHIYVQKRYPHLYKLAVTRLNPAIGQIILVSSYQVVSIEAYEALPVAYEKPKATREGGF